MAIVENSPILNIVATDPTLVDVSFISTRKWSTRVRKGNGIRWYENRIYTAFDSREKRNQLIICMHWSNSKDWDIRLRIPYDDVIEVDEENSQIAYWRYDDDGSYYRAVQNGRQIIDDIDSLIPENQPKVLRDLAYAVAEAHKSRR